MALASAAVAERPRQHAEGLDQGRADLAGSDSGIHIAGRGREEDSSFAVQAVHVVAASLGSPALDRAMVLEYMRRLQRVSARSTGLTEREARRIEPVDWARFMKRSFQRRTELLGARAALLTIALVMSSVFASFAAGWAAAVLFLLATGGVAAFGYRRYAAYLRTKAAFWKSEHARLLEAVKHELAGSPRFHLRWVDREAAIQDGDAGEALPEHVGQYARRFREELGRIGDAIERSVDLRVVRPTTDTGRLEEYIEAARDPFLAAFVRGHEPIYLLVWDAPGFGL